MNLQTISPEDLARLLAKTPGLTVIDVRTPAEFAESHAAPARNLPLPEATPAGLGALGHADASAPVYPKSRS
jgi:rhodanese-related sulfurtransferase